MPELPEVQTIVDDLKKRVVGKTIVDFWTDTPKIIKKPSLKEFRKKLPGSLIVDVQRIGKNIVFTLKLKTKKSSSDSNMIMLVHQKMTGHFLIGNWDLKKVGRKTIVIPKTKGPISSDKYNSYIRMIFYFDNGTQMALSDLRKFAKVILIPQKDADNLKDLKDLGPDVFSKKIDSDYLYSIFQKRKKAVKPILLEQQVVSGIGNIYGDESLFIAGINPLTKSNILSKKETAKIINSARKVIKKSLKLRGISSSDYRDTYGEKGGYDKVRFVYDREGLPCRICQTEIKRVKIGQRSSYFCSHCQKLK